MKITKIQNKKGIDWAKDNMFDAIGRPDLKMKNQNQTTIEFGIEEFRETLEHLRQCATGQKYPFWEKEERVDLIIEEIDNLLKKIKEL